MSGIFGWSESLGVRNFLRYPDACACVHAARGLHDEKPLCDCISCSDEMAMKVKGLP